MADDVDVSWNGARVSALIEAAAFEGVELAAEHLLQVSTQQAPLEEGDLARSGEVSTDRSDNAAAVSYDRPYAVRQHEELTWQHNAGKKAKYLEDPMNEERDTMLAIIAQAARKPFGG